MKFTNSYENSAKGIPSLANLERSKNQGLHPKTLEQVSLKGI
jgi:hypothetical protein